MYMHKIWWILLFNQEDHKLIYNTCMLIFKKVYRAQAFVVFLKKLAFNYRNLTAFPNENQKAKG